MESKQLSEALLKLPRELLLSYRLYSFQLIFFPISLKNFDAIPKSIFLPKIGFYFKIL